ncbi:MAG: Lrp/AsnC family transcriptional regulator [Clostridia bacterium]|nr:Lrp/AsnC family transcriptional regulator [Clostridia bacterium]MDE7306622.1 Lrp/AsnC family transcriptional regulator [Clostridia bacterium]
MDKLEKDVLSLITEDSRLTAKKIASMLGCDEKVVSQKISKLEEAGVIVKYTAIVNADSLEDESVEALIEVKVTPQRGHGFDMIANEIASHEEVQNLYLMSGAYDLAVIVKGKSLRSVSRFVSEKISTFDTVISTATHFILKKYKVEGATMTKSGVPDRLSVQA